VANNHSRAFDHPLSGETFVKNTLLMEELGRGYHDVEVTVEFDYQPAERAAWDSPGYSAHLELCSVTVGKYFLGDDVILRSQRPDWFKVLDAIAEKVVDGNLDYYTVEASRADDGY